MGDALAVSLGEGTVVTLLLHAFYGVNSREKDGRQSYVSTYISRSRFYQFPFFPVQNLFAIQMDDSEMNSRDNLFQSENLDREMDILKSLSSRASRAMESALKPEFGQRRADRNDAVMGSGDDFVSPGDLFRGDGEPVQRRYASEGIPERQGASRISTAKFMSVGKLPLEGENPIERRYAPEFEESHGRYDGRNQYFPMEERNAVAPGTGVMSSHRFPQSVSPGANWAGPGSILRGGEVSVRRKSGIQDVTTRESRRPKEREKDREYRRLTLTTTDFPLLPPSSTG